MCLSSRAGLYKTKKKVLEGALHLPYTVHVVRVADCPVTKSQPHESEIETPSQGVRLVPKAGAQGARSLFHQWRNTPSCLRAKMSVHCG